MLEAGRVERLGANGLQGGPAQRALKLGLWHGVEGQHTSGRQRASHCRCFHSSCQRLLEADNFPFVVDGCDHPHLGDTYHGNAVRFTRRSGTVTIPEVMDRTACLLRGPLFYAISLVGGRPGASSGGVWLVSSWWASYVRSLVPLELAPSGDGDLRGEKPRAMPLFDQRTLHSPIIYSVVLH